jgi:hypothetical protein
MPVIAKKRISIEISAIPLGNVANLGCERFPIHLPPGAMCGKAKRPSFNGVFTMAVQAARAYQHYARKGCEKRMANTSVRPFDRNLAPEGRASPHHFSIVLHR